MSTPSISNVLDLCSGNEIKLLVYLRRLRVVYAERNNDHSKLEPYGQLHFNRRSKSVVIQEPKAGQEWWEVDDKVAATGDPMAAKVGGQPNRNLHPTSTRTSKLVDNEADVTSPAYPGIKPI